MTGKCCKVERVQKRTIETIVGKTFKIEETTPIQYGGRWDNLEGAFEIVDERKRELKTFGPRFPTIYTIKALKPGEYTIEYQRLSPVFSEHPNEVVGANVYKVIVKPKK